jgi:hypothetical protein
VPKRSQKPQKPQHLPLEWLLTSPKAFSLRTATPLQRALCRASDGLPLGELWDHAEVQAAFGNTKPPEIAPYQFCILSAIRCGKSLFAAAKTIQISQTIDLSHPWISPGDQIRIPIVAPRTKEARAVYSHLVNNILAHESLKALLVGNPTEESFFLRHPSGRSIEVTITPLSKSGASLVACWMAAVIFDEAPLMSGVEDGAKNLDEALGQIAGRVIPGGQVLLIGSPWAPFGPIYDLVAEHQGKPSAEVVIARAPGPAMNPVYWTEKRCRELKKSNPVRYRTNVEAQFADLEESLFSSIEVEAAQRSEPLERPYIQGHYYVASMDPATRGNAWTLLLIECTGPEPGKSGPLTYAVAVARQWVGSKAAPLKPDDVIKEIAGLCKTYGLDTVISDQHSIDAHRDIAARHGLWIVEQVIKSDNRLEMVEEARILVSEKRLELPPDRQFVADLLSARKRVTQNGVTLVLPKSGDGRHADYVPALGLAFTRPPEPPEPANQPELDELDRLKARIEAQQNGDYLEQMALRVSGYR